MKGFTFRNLSNNRKRATWSSWWRPVALRVGLEQGAGRLLSVHHFPVFKGDLRAVFEHVDLLGSQIYLALGFAESCRHLLHGLANANLRRRSGRGRNGRRSSHRRIAGTSLSENFLFGLIGIGTL